MDDFEYAVLSDDDADGLFTGGDGPREDDFLSETIAKAASAERRRELRVLGLYGPMGEREQRAGPGALAGE